MTYTLGQMEEDLRQIHGMIHNVLQQKVEIRLLDAAQVAKDVINAGRSVSNAVQRINRIE